MEGRRRSRADRKKGNAGNEEEGAQMTQTLRHVFGLFTVDHAGGILFRGFELNDDRAQASVQWLAQRPNIRAAFCQPVFTAVDNLMVGEPSP
jgi:hypothetical protein